MLRSVLIRKNLVFFSAPPLSASAASHRLPWRQHWGNGYGFLRQQSFALEWTQK